MDFKDFISHFKVERESNGEYSCHCPAHGDKKASLHIRNANGKFLLSCKACCKTEEILAAVGLKTSDLYEGNALDQETKRKQYIEKRCKGKFIEEYNYITLNGDYAFTRVRYIPNGETDKKFVYGVIDDGKFTFGLPKAEDGKKLSRADIPAFYCTGIKYLQDAIKDGTTVFYVEGEKDVNTLQKKGYVAITFGAAGDWQEQCAKLFTNANVCILADNDGSGEELVKKAITSLKEVAKQIKVITPTPETPKGDISDYFAAGHTKAEFEKMVQDAKPLTAAQKPLLVPLTDFEEAEPEWFIPEYIPKYQITLMGGDGGSGKTSTWCDLVAAVSSGRVSLLEHELPDFIDREPQKVIFFSSEDSIVYTLKSRLRKCDANLSNILSISIKDEQFEDIKFDSPLLEKILAEYRPALVVFDPLQSFIPPDTQMGARNAMRACLNPLIGLGEKYKTTFLIVMHCNKQSGVWGRKRLADSSDMWDIARSVLLLGTTNEGMRYISQEKSNYGPLGETILFSINDGRVEFEGTTSKKDRDFVAEYDYTQRLMPQRESAKEFILDYLNNCPEGEMQLVGDMDGQAKAMGISDSTLRRAKQELKKEGRIKITSLGFGETKKWYISLIPSNK